MSAGMKLNLGTVIVVARPHGTNKGNVIRAGSDVRKPVTDLNARLAISLEAGLHGKDLRTGMSIGIALDWDAKLPNLRGIEHALVGSFAD